MNGAGAEDARGRNDTCLVRDFEWRKLMSLSTLKGPLCSMTWTLLTRSVPGFSNTLTATHQQHAPVTLPTLLPTIL